MPNTQSSSNELLCNVKSTTISELCITLCLKNKWQHLSRNVWIIKRAWLLQVLRDRLYKENKGKFVLWLQKVLVECCFIKLCISQGKLTSKDIAVESDVKTMEPVPHHCICKLLKSLLRWDIELISLWMLDFAVKKQSIPVVPWTGEQCAVLLYQPFMLLLHKLGFHLPVDAGKLFIRIPEFWTADILYSIAEKLGPIDKCSSKRETEFL